jgi:hypothetical protein
MFETAGLPFWELHFDKSGKLLKHVGAIPPQITDLFVFAHGWNNDYNDAKDLYDVFFEQLAQAVVEHGAKPDVQIGLAGVFWPAMLWPGDEPPLATTRTPMFGPVERDWSDELKTAFDGIEERAAIDRMREMIDKRPSHPEAITEFRTLLRKLAPEGTAEFDDLAALAPEDAPHQPGFPEALSKLWEGAREAVRLAAYVEVARRAIAVGERGLAPFLPTLPDSMRVHLLGHGFGSGLVGAAVSGAVPNVHSLFLMGVEENVEAASGLKLRPVFDQHADPLDPEVARAVLAAAGVA